MPRDREAWRRWQRIVPVLALCGCDVVFRLDRVSEGDAGAEPRIDASADLVAHYRFESPGPTIVDETGRHDGLVMGSGALARAPGYSGMAIEFPIGTPPGAYVVVPDSPEFDLLEGSIDLWVRTSAQSGDLGIFSRDSTGTSGGQIALVQRQSTLIVRLQRSIDGGGGGGAFICSEPVPLETWVHVGINLGAPKAELWVDGIEQLSTQSISIFGVTANCGAADARSLVGNDDPIVLGALGVQSEAGTSDQISFGFAAGAIDELRVLRTRQDFAAR